MTLINMFTSIQLLPENQSVNPETWHWWHWLTLNNVQSFSTFNNSLSNNGQQQQAVTHIEIRLIQTAIMSSLGMENKKKLLSKRSDLNLIVWKIFQIFVFEWNYTKKVKDFQFLIWEVDEMNFTIFRKFFPWKFVAAIWFKDIYLLLKS